MVGAYANELVCIWAGLTVDRYIGWLVREIVKLTGVCLSMKEHTDLDTYIQLKAGYHWLAEGFNDWNVNTYVHRHINTHICLVYMCVGEYICTYISYLLLPYPTHRPHSTCPTHPTLPYPTQPNSSKSLITIPFHTIN